MSRIIFRDFDEFAAAINGISGRFVSTARPQTDWWVQAWPAGRVAIQQVQIGGAATFVGDGSDKAITLGIPVATRQRIRIDGQFIADNSFIVGKANQPFTFAAAQATQWAGIQVPLDHALLAPELLDSLNANASRGTHAQTPLPYVTSARRLISRLFADDGSIDLSAAAVAGAMEEEIMAVTSHVLEASSKAQRARVGRPRFSRGTIVARALEVIEENEGQPLLLRDLCRATQVSERTLRNIFQEYFGVGPMRMLKVNQLSEIRAALMAAEPGEKTITSIVTHFGVWDFSSFARNYKALYGETASETLRRPAVRNHYPGTAHASWMRFASRKFADPLHGSHF